MYSSVGREGGFFYYYFLISIGEVPRSGASMDHRSETAGTIKDIVDTEFSGINRLKFNAVFCTQGRW